MYFSKFPFILYDSVGDGNFTLTGDKIPTQLKVGDRVVLPTQGFTKLPFNGEDYLVGPENNVLARMDREVSIEDALESTEISEQDKENLTDI